VSISRIEQLLVSAGAQHIAKTYDGQTLKGLVFSLPLPDKRTIPVRLPARSNEVYEVLRREISRPRSGTLDRLKDQAERTAWKLVHEWVHLQLSMIQLGQVQALEVFMPYIVDSRTNLTLFQSLEKNNFKQLPFSGGHE
jgi:hypothetical protein